jgi:ribosomal protein S18 acetylase RimI-like enzyme
MQLSLAVNDDALGIAETHVRTWQAAYQGIVPAEYLDSLSVVTREAAWRESIIRGTPEILVAREQAAVSGFVAYGACRDEGVSTSQGEIWAIYVTPSLWSRGIGRRLWLAARERLTQQDYQRVSLWVLAENVRAIRFYRAAGFSPDPLHSKERIIAGKSLQEILYVAALA